MAALGGYVNARQTIPQPSQMPGCATISLPALTAAKIALYSAMHVQGVSNTHLAQQLRLSEGAVRRLVDLEHRSHIGQVENALHVLGHRLTVGTRAASSSQSEQPDKTIKSGDLIRPKGDISFD